MKVVDTSLLATYRSGGPTIAAGVKIVRTDGETFRWISLDRDVVIGGDTYESAPGLDVTSIVSTEGFGVDNAEIRVLDTGAEITRAGILAGVWNSATFEIFEVDWKATAPVKNVLKSGKVGNFTAKRGVFVAEFRDLRQAMQSPRETVMQPTCRYKLGVRDAQSHCPVNLADYTLNDTVASSPSGYSVVGAVLGGVDDYFGEGKLTFTSGANVGLSQKIKSYVASTKTFVFWEQFVYPISPGDAYTASAGCRLRFQEDCIAKFGAGIDFGGEPNKKNPDTLSAPAWVATGATVPGTLGSGQL